jgi:hypothetical protein
MCPNQATWLIIIVKNPLISLVKNKMFTLKASLETHFIINKQKHKHKPTNESFPYRSRFTWS